MIDPEFPDKMRAEALEWRILIDGDDMSPEEQIRFEAWLDADKRHSQAFDQATTVWAAFGTFDDDMVEESYRRMSALDTLRERLARAPWKRRGGRSLAPALGGVAAFLLAGAIILTQFEPQSVELEQSSPPEIVVYSTNIGEVEMLALSDGSEITIGAGTELHVAMAETIRTVKIIRGAAVFDVTPDPNRPFMVQAEALSARVVGTVFDVRNNGGVVRLSVEEGQVEVTHPLMLNGEPTQLINSRAISAGERITAATEVGLGAVEGFDKTAFALWRSERLAYAGAPLSELIADANRYSNIPIVVDSGSADISDAIVTFTYDARDLDNMLAVLPALFPVTVDRTKPDQIVIRQNSD